MLRGKKIGNAAQAAFLRSQKTEVGLRGESAFCAWHAFVEAREKKYLVMIFFFIKDLYTPWGQYFFFVREEV